MDKYKKIQKRKREKSAAFPHFSQVNVGGSVDSLDDEYGKGVGV